LRDGCLPLATTVVLRRRAPDQLAFVVGVPSLAASALRTLTRAALMFFAVVTTVHV
jgi:hypothetical protein